jgi:aminoglycoside phosphotransferase (APT) family kinase protein
VRSTGPNMQPGSSEVALPDDLLAWMEEVGGGAVRMADRRPGGGRREAWVVDLEGRDGTLRPCFLRYDRSDPARTKDPWTLHREATVYLALQSTAVPVPRVLGVHAVAQAMLTERVRGENWFSRITDVDEREATARDFMTHLAALHALDVSTLDLPAFPTVKTVSDAVRAELDEFEWVLAARGGESDPALAFSLRWLRDHVPDDDGPPVLVQGDTGPGNFLYEGGRVTAVVDWELAHLGDPMDDIAWLSLRATQEPFGDFPTRLREYELLSGNRVDEERVRYFRVMAETKLQVMAHGAGRRSERPTGVETDEVEEDGDDAGRGGGGGADAGNAFVYGLLHRRLWLEALAAVTGVELVRAEELRARPAEDHDWMYDAVLAQLRNVIVPRTDDALAQARGKGVARLIKYLSRVDVYGLHYEACEREDLGNLLDIPVDSVSAGRADAAAAVEAGTVRDEDYLAFLWRRIARETELARPAMGVLADRHWPELP